MCASCNTEKVKVWVSFSLRQRQTELSGVKQGGSLKNPFNELFINVKVNSDLGCTTVENLLVKKTRKNNVKDNIWLRILGLASWG